MFRSSIISYAILERERLWRFCETYILYQLQVKFVANCGGRLPQGAERLGVVVGIEETVKKGAADMHMPGHFPLCVQQLGNYTADAARASATFQILCALRNLALER